MRGFLKSQRGINTVEVVIILAILVGLAILFKDQISAFVTTLLGKTLDPNQF
jgi:hypothetical protein